jgi:predicted MFS family arabinose efflux permease
VAGGLLIARWSVGVALLLSAFGVAVYLCAIALLRYVPRAETSEARLDIFSGAREILGRPIVLAVTLLTFFFFLAYGPLEVALPVAARETFHTNAWGYGLLWTAYALGSVSGLLLLRARYQHVPAMLMLSAIAVMWGVLASALAFAHSLGVAMLVLLVAGFLWSPYNALEQAFMQVQIPERLQAAVFSMQSSFLYTLAVPLGAMLGGWAMGHTTPQTVMFASGAACVISGLAGYAGARRSGGLPAPAMQPRS